MAPFQDPASTIAICLAFEPLADLGFIGFFLLQPSKPFSRFNVKHRRG